MVARNTGWADSTTAMTTVVSVLSGGDPMSWTTTTSTNAVVTVPLKGWARTSRPVEVRLNWGNWGCRK